MPVIIFVENNGTRHDLEGTPGDTLMQVARNNDVPGIIAECNGAAACATCRIQVDGAWQSKIPAPGPLEVSLLEGFEEIMPGDRLSCQITCTEDLDGLVVNVPVSQW